LPLLGVTIGCLPLEPTSPTPVIESVDPTEAAAGQEVTVGGSHFGASQGGSSVTFGDVRAAAALAWSDGEIRVAVPEAEPGEVQIVVKVKGVASDPVAFVVAAAPVPVISSIEPQGAEPGTAVTITGSAFGVERGPEDTVLFAERLDAAEGISSWTETTVEVTIPEAAVSGDVTLIVGGVSSAPFLYTVGGDAPPDAGTGPTLTQVQEEIFTPTCAQSECHDRQTARSGLVLEAGLAYANLVNVASQERPAVMRVAPGAPDDSYLYLKITRALPPEGDRMPQGLLPLPGRLISLVQAWIEAGAPNN
jgi:hypothetical protein